MPTSSVATHSPGSRCCGSHRAGVDAADAMIRRVLGEAEDPIVARAPARRLRRDRARRGRHRRGAPRRRRAPQRSPPNSGRRCLRAHAAAARRRGAPWPTATRRPRSSSCARAFNEFHALGVRLRSGRTRLLIADACEALGDHDAAEMESSAARADARVARQPGPRRATTDRGPPCPTGSPPASSRCSPARPRQDQPDDRRASSSSARRPSPATSATSSPSSASPRGPRRPRTPTTTTWSESATQEYEFDLQSVSLLPIAST